MQRPMTVGVGQRVDGTHAQIESKSLTLGELATKLKMHKKQQKVQRLSPFWAKRQAQKQASFATERPFTAVQKATSAQISNDLKNLSELTKVIPSQERCCRSVNCIHLLLIFYIF